MNTIKYPLAESTWDSAEIDAIQSVIATDRYSMGSFVETFEAEFASFTGSKYCVMVNSGSSANLLAVASLFFCKEPKLKAGDEVIVPAVSWSTTYYPLHQYGLKLKFVDVDKETLNIDLKCLEEAITPQTKAIFAVNLLGNSNDYEAISKIIASRNILLLEDNCESLGATFSGKQAGTFGLLGTFSSFFSHHISTMEGGMIVTDDEELYHILLSLRAHGWTRNLPKTNKVTGVKSDDPFTESFKFVLPGYNVRPIEMFGALGSVQLKKLPDFVKWRRKNAEVFQSSMSDFEFIKIQREVGESSWFGFSMLFDSDLKMQRSDIVNLFSENEIDCRPIVAGNFAKNPVINYFNYSIHNELNNADFVDQQGLFVGNHHYDLSSQIEHLRNILSKVH
ncbi:MAG: pyridoxamine 5-phosphate oxidase [Bdellovibrionaceae bacterium]|nr:pyridoxamine 5-phosphate oxidase [Pseudobdellovibrionaceae bacterium]|tara:strand:+ start:64000 stop:65178 length:1179 start_codon:yes stop_codon:yes gene_type:complete